MAPYLPRSATTTPISSLVPDDDMWQDRNLAGRLRARVSAIVLEIRFDDAGRVARIYEL